MGFMSRKGSFYTNTACHPAWLGTYIHQGQLALRVCCYVASLEGWGGASHFWGMGTLEAPGQLEAGLWLCHLSNLDSSLPCLTAGEQPDASLPLHVLPLYSLLAPEKQAQVMEQLFRALRCVGQGCSPIPSLSSL